MEFVVAVVFLIINLVWLWRISKSTREQEEIEEKKLLNVFVDDVKSEIEKLKSKYPDLAPDAVVEGSNSHKLYDQGNIYDEFKNLTFPIHTPTASGSDSSGATTLESRNYITLTVSGTVADYTVTGVSKLSKGKSFKVVYSSKQGNAIEGMVSS